MTAASELARNTLIHGGGGTVRLEPLDDGRAAGLRLDLRGPGARASPTSSWRCRTATRPASGLGLGLGGAKRLSTSSRSQSRGRRGHARDDHAVEVIVASRPPIGRRSTTPSGVGEARGARRRWLAARSGFDATAAGQRGARRSPSWRPTSSSTPAAASCSCSALDDGDAGGVEMLALDAGPGMADVAACLRDGYSTAGTPGQRAGGDRAPGRRASTSTRRPAGHGVLRRGSGARPRAARTAGRRSDVARLLGAGRAARRSCGDAWARRRRRATERRCSSSTGSATAPQAAEAAARGACELPAARRAAGPAEIAASGCTRALRSTRGAAVAVASIDRDARAGPLRRRRQHRRRDRRTASASREHGLAQRHRRARRCARSRSSPIPVPPARCSSCTPTAWPPTGTSTRYPGPGRAHPGADRRRAVPRLHARGRDDVDGRGRPRGTASRGR